MSKSAQIECLKFKILGFLLVLRLQPPDSVNREFHRVLEQDSLLGGPFHSNEDMTTRSASGQTG